MLGITGISPVSSVTAAGLKEFLSVLRPKNSRAFGDSADRYYRAYTNTRGILINKEFVSGVPQLEKGYRFQFNPQTIDDIKQTLWEAREYTGLAFNDYVWAHGGERTISFQLFLDNTPGSKTPAFRPKAYGSKEAHTIQDKAMGAYSYDTITGRPTTTNNKRFIGQSTLEEVGSELRSLKSGVTSVFNPAAGPKSIAWAGEGYSLRRIDERGILPEVELLQSFLYPAVKNGEATPAFASGGIVSENQFRPPVTTILCVGPIYLEGHVSAAPVHYTLFDSDLTPIRATVDIEFTVYEFESLSPQALGRPTGQTDFLYPEGRSNVENR